MDERDVNFEVEATIKELTVRSEGKRWDKHEMQIGDW